MSRLLDENEVIELNQWLCQKHIPLQNLHRTFADGVAVAQMIKKIHPKMVDMNNYPSCSSKQLKVKNWETLNYKILNKLKMHQGSQSIDNIVKLVPGSIEALLYRIMKYEKLQMSKLTKDEQEQMWLENEDIIYANVAQKKNDSIIKVSEKLILYSIYENVQKDGTAIDTLLKASEFKLCHLKKLLNLKEERIKELKLQLEKQKTKLSFSFR